MHLHQYQRWLRHQHRHDPCPFPRRHGVSIVVIMCGLDCGRVQGLDSGAAASFHSVTVLITTNYSWLIPQMPHI